MVPAKRVQFTLRLERQVYEVLKTYALTNGISIQNAINIILKSGLAADTVLAMSSPHMARVMSIVADIQGPDRKSAADQYLGPEPPSNSEENVRLITLWVGYIHAMPREKVDLFTKAMEWDLRTAQSARLKSTKAKRKVPIPNGKPKKARKR